ASGRILAQDYDRAGQYYRKAGEQGNAQALNNLGGMYVDGIGVLPNRAEALKWFKESEKHTNPVATQNLYWMQAYGDTVPEDTKHALIWCEKKAPYRPAVAALLGRIYYRGEYGV